MKRHILLISAISFLMLIPVIQHQIYGADINSPVMQENSVVVSDDNLKAAIDNAIESDMQLAKFASAIDVEVDKGVVTLTGDVDSSAVRSSIESKVTNIVGVKKVINNIEVKS